MILTVLFLGMGTQSVYSMDKPRISVDSLEIKKISNFDSYTNNVVDGANAILELVQKSLDVGKNNGFWNQYLKSPDARTKVKHLAAVIKELGQRKELNFEKIPYSNIPEFLS